MVHCALPIVSIELKMVEVGPHLNLSQSKKQCIVYGRVQPLIFRLDCVAILALH